MNGLWHDGDPATVAQSAEQGACISTAAGSSPAGGSIADALMAVFGLHRVEHIATFFVAGKPVPQPRARVTTRGRFAHAYTPAKHPVNDWRAAIADQAREHIVAGLMAGPVRCDLLFNLPRPDGHFGTGRNAGKLKATAPALHTGKPDLDNLAKPVLDVLTELGAWGDDGCVVQGLWSKRWADLGGVLVTISEVCK